jgi:small subunit ribosomal protein S1
MPSPETDNSEESFSDIFSAYEQSHARTGQQIEATVVVVTADSVLLDIGYKTEGVLPLALFANETVTPGDKMKKVITHFPASK